MNPDSEKAALIEALSEVIDSCPFDHSNPLDCPLHGLRDRSRRERLAFVESLSVGEMEDLIVYHWLCLESKILPGCRIG